MKIIQLLGTIEGYGITRYIIELNAALKMIGHDVEVMYFNNNLKSTNNTQNIPDLICMDYGQEMIDRLNSADVVLIHTLINKKASDKHKKNFYHLAQDLTEPITAIFCNDHNSTAGYITYVNEFTGGEDGLDFVKNIDKFITFSPLNPNFQKILKAYPELINKYVHLQHPYRFTEKTNVEFEKKYKRITYLGRFSLLKDPMLLMRHREQFIANGYQLEMRGLDRSPAVAFTPDLIYKFHEDGSRTASPFTKELILKRNINEYCKTYGEYAPDFVHHIDRELDKIYLFGRYKRDEGLEAVSYSQFGCNFNHNRNSLRLGNNIEYSVAEVIDAGTIPLLNYTTMENCRLYDENGKITDERAIDHSCGICFMKDGSNFEDALAQINKLSANKDLYNKYRHDCLEFYKRLYDPKMVATRLVRDLMSTDNSEALSEFKI